jgi:hypothetical protein
MNFKKTIRIASVAAILAVAANAALAVDAQTLDGWGALRFGMSPDQARAVPGLNFGKYSPKDLLERNLGAMASTKPALINGIPYKFDLFFNAYSALFEIALWNEKPTNRAECEARFLSLLNGLEKSYGSFAPVYPVRKKNDQDQMPTSVEWIGQPAHYALATVYLGQETANVWNGRKDIGGRTVDTAAVWSAANEESQAVCLTEIDFKA